MANSTTTPNGSSKVEVNGTTSAHNLSTQSQVNLILAANGGHKRIQSKVKERLDEAGWSQDLREYCTRLFRSGEAVTYDDCMAIVTKRVNECKAGNVSTGEQQFGVAAPDLTFPEESKKGFKVAVEKELEPILELKKK